MKRNRVNASNDDDEMKDDGRDFFSTVCEREDHRDDCGNRRVLVAERDRNWQKSALGKLTIYRRGSQISQQMNGR